MDVAQDEYHVRIDHHTATPSALADAQLALLERRSIDPRLAVSRRWTRRALVVLGLVVAGGFLLLVMAGSSAGRASAFENCVADAEGMASKLSAAQLDTEVQGVAASVEELCAGYRG